MGILLGSFSVRLLYAYRLVSNVGGFDKQLLILVALDFRLSVFLSINDCGCGSKPCKVEVVLILWTR